ncbi:MAG TPA: hydrogenase formation protein HypD [Anaerohalosphaeraceae bacterium]|nr:hydrogenase formation protein HypD [Anaerohalosphaeraceae bacterium]
MRLDVIQSARNELEQACSTIGRLIQVMEVCGTHTVALFRHGIRAMLPANLKLLSGPGCPVCVTDQGYIDTVIDLARRPDCLIATYGDMIRVPGRDTSLERLTLPNVRVVLSSDDAVTLAQKHPDKTVIFIAVGFETTTPATAVAIRQAQELGLKNFTVLCGHKRVLPAMHALLSGQNDKIDAFLCPGHVSVILGSRAYEPVVKNFNRPCVVAGFEAEQILLGLAKICRQIADKKPAVDSVYSLAVRPEGNPVAIRIIDQIFEPCDGPWRGLGCIPAGALRIRDAYADFDAQKRFGIDQIPTEEPGGCQCGKVLCGLMEPSQCGLFGKKCTPDHPVGPCMVSTEGACAAWYKYQR